MEHHEYAFPLKNADLDRALEVLRALAEETRFRIVFLLSREEMSVGEMVRVLDVPQSTVSRHLAILRNTHLVLTRRDGTAVFYRLGNAHLGRIALETLSFSEHERLALPDHTLHNHSSSVEE